MEARYLTECHAELIRDAGKAGTPCRPSNGTEGMMFEERLCQKCKKDQGEPGCQIIVMMMMFGIADEQYPKEVVYSENGYPSCTAFEEVT